MKIIADLHIHSPYSRAVSKAMTLPNLDYYARLKGKVCIDWNYRPAAKNLFLKYAEDNGAIIYNALEFLITGCYYTFHSISDKRAVFDYDILLSFAKED